jgi:hypothetical protein
MRSSVNNSVSWGLGRGSDRAKLVLASQMQCAIKWSQQR